MIANELEIAILNLFVDIKIRYPNLVVGKLDRAHVKAAMEKGISANQVSRVSFTSQALTEDYQLFGKPCTFSNVQFGMFQMISKCPFDTLMPSHRHFCTRR